MVLYLGIKVKNYGGKIIKNKTLIYNCIFILLMFTLIQIVGVAVCFRFLNRSLTMTLATMCILNFILYKILDF